MLVSSAERHNLPRPFGPCLPLTELTLLVTSIPMAVVTAGYGVALAGPMLALSVVLKVRMVLDGADGADGAQGPKGDKGDPGDGANVDLSKSASSFWY